MSELFNNLKQALIEAIESIKNGYQEDTSDVTYEDLEPLECDCITSSPEELSDGVQEESEDNMLLSKKGDI